LSISSWSEWGERGTVVGGQLRGTAMPGIQRSGERDRAAQPQSVSMVGPVASGQRVGSGSRCQDVGIGGIRGGGAAHVRPSPNGDGWGKFPWHVGRVKERAGLQVGRARRASPRDSGMEKGHWKWGRLGRFCRLGRLTGLVHEGIKVFDFFENDF
jgi:hypothetical protein